MKSSCRCAAIIVCLTAVCLNAAAADSRGEAKAALKSCFEQHMPEELSKAEPKYDSLRIACAQEFDEFLSTLPGEIAEKYKRFIQEDTDNELKNRVRN